MSFSILLMIATLGPTAQADDPGACRAIVDRDARLDCYDRATAREASASDATAVRTDPPALPTSAAVATAPAPRSRRTAPAATARPTEAVELRIAGASRGADGRWMFRLDDGSTWAQTDDRRLSADPQSGQAIRIRPAAMGSFLANVNRQIALRVRRVN